MRPSQYTHLLLTVILIAGNLNAQLVTHNRYWFKDSATGKGVYLFGHGITNLVSQVQIDIIEHNRHYSSFGANTLRLHLTQGAFGAGAPWKQLSDGRYDLEQWNDIYWRRLKLFMDDCLRRRIYPFIQIWDEPVIERGSSRWRVHPFRPSNNVNTLQGLNDDPEGHGMKGFYDLRNEKLIRLQRSFLKRVLDFTAPCGICIYSICNEYDFGNNAPVDWQDYWIDYFRSYEQEHPSLPAPILFTNTTVKKYMISGADRFPVLDWYYLGRDYRLKNFGRDGKDLVGTEPGVLARVVQQARSLFPHKILINSRPTSSPDRGRKDFSNEEETRFIAWCFFMSGSHLAGFRHLNTENMGDTRPWLRTDPECIVCSDGLAVERVLKSVHELLRLADPNLLDLVPESILDSEFPVLMLTGSEEKIVYLPRGGTVKIGNLEQYAVIVRYDPLHPDRGLVPADGEEKRKGSLLAPGPETVYFLRKGSPVVPGNNFR